MSDDDFHIIEANQRLLKQAQDQDDLNNERSGNNVGRISRFGLENSTINMIAQKKKDYQDLLERIIMSAAYKEAFSQAMAALNETESAVYDALVDISEKLAVSETHMNKILDNAQELPDGTKIFLSKDGGYFRMDGTKVPKSEIVDLDLRDNASSFEEFRTAEQAFHFDQTRFNQISEYSAEVAEIREGIENTENRPSIEKLEELETRLNQIKNTVSINQTRTVENDFEIKNRTEASPQFLELDSPKF